jgi:hypothetical protein
MSNTSYAVLPFARDKTATPRREKRRKCLTAARWRVGQPIMAADSGNCGAVAFSRTGDPLGDWADAVILKQIGDIGELPSS